MFSINFVTRYTFHFAKKKILFSISQLREDTLNFTHIFLNIHW